MQVQDRGIWQLLMQRTSVRLAVSIIILACLIAIFAYPLAPDHTPNANRIIIELSAKPPGFHKLFLKEPISAKPVKRSFLHRIFLGQEADSKLMPINSFRFSRDSLMVSHYIDEGVSDTLSFSLRSLLPSSSGTRTVSEMQGVLKKEYLDKYYFILGTDRYGRDILSRLLIGTRVSIAVGIVAVLFSLGIGILLGAIAGYFRGWVDNVVMYLINILWAIPTLLLVFAITLAIGKGFLQIFFAIGLTMWVGAARLIRGQVMVLREMEYVQAAKTLGLGSFRIIYRHILPNIAGPIMVIAASNFAAAILIEAGLSFLGIGVQPPMPSWGLMIKEHYNFLLTNRPILAIIPGIAIMILVYAFNILGNALRDVLDVRERF